METDPEVRIAKITVGLINEAEIANRPCYGWLENPIEIEVKRPNSPVDINVRN
jgi:hypothetical protein